MPKGSAAGIKAGETREKRRQRAIQLKNRPALSQAQRDQIALGSIESFLDGILHKSLRCVECDKEIDVKKIDPGRVQLIRMRYDKLRPSLSSVEQTVIDPRDKATEDQLLAELQATLASHPAMLDLAIKVALQVDPTARQRIMGLVAVQEQRSTEGDNRAMDENYSHA